jgi:hypothetical protein
MEGFHFLLESTDCSTCVFRLPQRVSCTAPGQKEQSDTYTLGWTEFESHCDGVLAECSSTCINSQGRFYSRIIDIRDIESLADVESIESQNDFIASWPLTSARASSFPNEIPLTVCPALITTVILESSGNSLTMARLSKLPSSIGKLTSQTFNRRPNRRSLFASHLDVSVVYLHIDTKPCVRSLDVNL